VSGKGDDPRPMTVPKRVFDANFDRIFGQKQGSEAGQPSAAEPGSGS
jgi:hypothetical protein